MLNVSREFMFWAVVCALNQCCAFTDWEQNVPWYLLQLRCMSVTNSHLLQAWKHFFGGLPRRFLISQLYAEEKGFLYLILEMCFLESTNIDTEQSLRGVSQRGRRIYGDVHIYLWVFFLNRGRANACWQKEAVSQWCRACRFTGTARMFVQKLFCTGFRAHCCSLCQPAPHYLR